jgi:hypothetical protein
MVSFGAPALPLHLVPRVELDVGGLDEEFFIPLLNLLLQGWHIDTGQRVAV